MQSELKTQRVDLQQYPTAVQDSIVEYQILQSLRAFSLGVPKKYPNRPKVWLGLVLNFGFLHSRQTMEAELLNFYDFYYLATVISYQ